MIPKRCDNCGKKLKADGPLCATCKYTAERKASAPLKEAEAKLAEKEEARRSEQWQRINAERAVDAAEERAAHKLNFLTALISNGGHVQHACKDAGIAEGTIRRYADEDPDFQTAWYAVQDTNVERLEIEADRRAMGYREDTYDERGKIVKSVTRFSDNLIMFRLKALRPEKYRDGPNVAGRTGAQLSETELNDALSKMMARRKQQVDQVSEEVQ